VVEDREASDSCSWHYGAMVMVICPEMPRTGAGLCAYHVLGGTYKLMRGANVTLSIPLLRPYNPSR
jgi:hypothetical protein